MSLIPLFARESSVQIPIDLSTLYLNITQGALEHGVQSVEADIWAFPDGPSSSNTTTTSTADDDTRYNDVLYVAHTEDTIKSNWTLELLYLDPIWKLLEESNGGIGGSKGVFLSNTSHTLFLFLDSKSDASSTWPLVEKSLQRFQDANYLTYYDESSAQWIYRPLTIVLTGNLPTDNVKALPVRYVTLDGDLTLFKDGKSQDDMQAVQEYSIVASASMTNVLGSSLFQAFPFTSGDKTTLKQVIDNAHKYNIKTRIWGGVTWLDSLRDDENDVLYDDHTDLLNIDDLSLSSKYV